MKIEITLCILSDHYTTRTQQQKKQQKIFPYLETEQHIAPWSVGHPGNKGGNKKVPGIYWEWKQDL
jgi:hypothetical protein